MMDWTAYIWIGATMLLFYFLLIMPQKKRETSQLPGGRRSYCYHRRHCGQDSDRQRRRDHH